MIETTTTERLTEEIIEKYTSQGQDPNVYLEGLKYSKPVTYWDYCEIDTLLSLQKTRTLLPDEEVFIMYHQVTELYFKMILSEIKQIANHPKLDSKFFVQRLRRINRYFNVLIYSFDVMRDGMETEQYMKFRHTLTPASGFQSAQYRMIEICCTDLQCLVDKEVRANMPADAPVAEKFKKIYWQAGGTDPKTGEKSWTLQFFEDKYLDKFVKLAEDYETKNIWQCYARMNKVDRTNELLVEAMRQLDHKVNVEWPLVHYRTALKYLEEKGKTVEATGGSAWKKYLHPKSQRRIFFPELWNEEELGKWGHNPHG